MFKISQVAVVATIGLAAITLGATKAHADIKPTNAGSPISVVNVGGVWQYTYGIRVDDEQQVSPGSFFTFYDFSGYVTGSATFSSPYSWSTSEAALTPNPVLPAVGSGSVILGQIPGGNPDLASLTNITFTYQGGAVIPGEQYLGTFTLSSIYGPQVTGSRRAFAGQGYINNTGNPGIPNANVTTYVAPTASVVPEPSEYAFMAFTSASLIGLVVRARRRKTAA